MNKVLLVCAMVLFTTTTIAEEKSITPQEFGNAIKETPGKLVTFIQGEVDKPKEYQKESWADMKEQTAQTWAKLKSLVVKN